jgi:hypothetical protein
MTTEPLPSNGFFRCFDRSRFRRTFHCGINQEYNRLCDSTSYLLLNFVIMPTFKLIFFL